MNGRVASLLTGRAARRNAPCRARELCGIIDRANTENDSVFFAHWVNACGNGVVKESGYEAVATYITAGKTLIKRLLFHLAVAQVYP